MLHQKKNKAKNYYYSILNSGIKVGYNYALVRRIKMVNTFSFWASFLWILFGIWLFILEFYLAFTINISSAFVCFLVLYLNEKHKHIVSFYIFQLWMLIGVLFLTLNYGRDSGTHYILIPWLATSSFLFEKPQHSAPLFLLGFVSFIGVEYFHHNYEYLDKYTIPYIQWIMAIMSIILFRLVAEYFKKDSYKYQKQINDKNKKLEEQRDEIMLQKELLAEQNIEIEEQNNSLSKVLNQLRASVTYARRIQDAILLPEYLLSEYLEKFFIFHKPKDIVSGDFYWFREIYGKTIIVIADCTGHGVPGAFMTAISNTLLNQIVEINKLTSPSSILKELQSRLTYTLHQKLYGDKISDGMDISICTIDNETDTLLYSGAKRPLYVFRGGDLTVYKGEPFSIGNTVTNNVAFKDIEISINHKDRFYMFSDGYADQFGGKFKRKMKIKTFKEYLSKIQSVPINEHKKLLGNYLAKWQQHNDQVDDILIFGFEY